MDDLVRYASVEPVEAGDDVRHVQERPPVLHHLQRKFLQRQENVVDLVEDVIPEELEHVPVPSLRPGLIQVQLSPVHLWFFIRSQKVMLSFPTFYILLWTMEKAHKSDTM